MTTFSLRNVHCIQLPICSISARKPLFEEGCYQLNAKLQRLCSPSLPPETHPGLTWAVHHVCRAAPTSWEAAILSSPCWLAWFWTISRLGSFRPSSSCRSSFIRTPSHIISGTLTEMSPYFCMFLRLSGWGILPLQGLQKHRVVKQRSLSPTHSFPDLQHNVRQWSKTLLLAKLHLLNHIIVLICSLSPWTYSLSQANNVMISILSPELFWIRLTVTLSSSYNFIQCFWEELGGKMAQQWLYKSQFNKIQLFPEFSTVVSTILYETLLFKATSK